MATAQKFLARNSSGPGMQEVTGATLGGVSYAGQVPVLNPTTGLLDLTMMPAGVGADTDTAGVCGAVSLTAGMYVNIYNNGGTKTIRPADSTDATKPAHGYVIAGFSESQPVTVYLPGSINPVIPVGSFTAADVGKAIYLGTNGAITTTRPSTTGNLDQQLGFIDNVGTTVSSSFCPTAPIVVA